MSLYKLSGKGEKKKKRGWVSSNPAYLKRGEACLVLVRDFCREDNTAGWWQPVRNPPSGPQIAGGYLNVTACTEGIVGWVATISLKPCVLAYKYRGSPISEFLSASESQRGALATCHPFESIVSAVSVERMQRGLLVMLLRCLKTGVCRVYSPFSNISLFLALFKNIFSSSGLLRRSALSGALVTEMLCASTLPFLQDFFSNPDLILSFSSKFWGNSICWRKNRGVERFWEASRGGDERLGPVIYRHSDESVLLFVRLAVGFLFPRVNHISWNAR